MRLSSFLIKDTDNKKFIVDYSYADVVLRIYTLFWFGYIFYSYHKIINRPESLYEPIIWLQKLLIPSQLSLIVFYTIIALCFSLCIITLISKKIIFRAILFLLILIVNTFKFNFNYFSHVGHLLILSHFFTIFIPPKNISNLKDTAIKEFSNAIRWSYAGVLVTYSMAGFWKFLSLGYRIILQPKAINWMSKDAVELNAIVSARLWDESVSKTMLALYEIPYLWQIATLIIFFFQLISVFGAFNKKLSYAVLIVLVLFHIYNMIFINTLFYATPIVLLILLFPYHLIFKKT